MEEFVTERVSGAEQLIAIGRKEGIAQERRNAERFAQGKVLQAKKEIAKNLLKRQLSPETISKDASLPLSDVLVIQKALEFE